MWIESLIYEIPVAATRDTTSDIQNFRQVKERLKPVPKTGMINHITAIVATTHLAVSNHFDCIAYWKYWAYQDL
ncbi:MAG: hypothetical protein A3F68_02855 [Acidobacteria bacterium RIFCSPLOWO2_12_FULL_54_10]|nr:MAG: hypothetical protein A3F68_02855 [Acidobacteria bacterium RIFCSPLOWO2_12_FULL_54_10]